MAVGCYSEAEKVFILYGVEENFRYDGRTRSEYRPIEIETDIVPHANGSARLRLANTDILVGVKAEIDCPTVEHPDKGKIEFFVDCSANATPAFEGRGGEDLANDLSGALARAYSAPQALDQRTLCILPKFQCWKLYVDILILECGGNLFDAVGLGVKAALRNTLIPRVVAAVFDGAGPELILSDDPHDCWKLDTTNAPLLVSVVKIGDSCVVDPGAEEEAVSGGGVLVSYSNGLITTILKLSGGSLNPGTLKEMIQLGASAGEGLQKALEKALKEEEALGANREKAGFLKIVSLEDFEPGNTLERDLYCLRPIEPTRQYNHVLLRKKFIQQSMVKYATKFGVEEPYSIPNKGPTPKIDKEEGLPLGALDIAWVEDDRKNLYHWSTGLKWHDRLHAHATMNSARRNAKCKRPFEPKDELDFVLGAAYCPSLETFSEKTDPYLQIETALGEDMNIEIQKRNLARQARNEAIGAGNKSDLRKPKFQAPEKLEVETWRLLKNRIVIYPDKSVPRGHPLIYSNGSVEKRENIYNVKLGIAADHSPQTNPGYSRTPSGAFYSI